MRGSESFPGGTNPRYATETKNITNIKQIYAEEIILSSNLYDNDAGISCVDTAEDPKQNVTNENNQIIEEEVVTDILEGQTEKNTRPVRNKRVPLKFDYFVCMLSNVDSHVPKSYKEAMNSSQSEF